MVPEGRIGTCEEGRVIGRVTAPSIYSLAVSTLRLPFQLALLMFSGWVNRHQLDVIEYLQEGDRVLKERLGGRH